MLLLWLPIAVWNMRPRMQLLLHELLLKHRSPMTLLLASYIRSRVAASLAVAVSMATAIVSLLLLQAAVTLTVMAVLLRRWPHILAVYAVAIPPGSRWPTTVEGRLLILNPLKQQPFMLAASGQQCLSAARLKGLSQSFMVTIPLLLHVLRSEQTSLAVVG